MDYLLVIGLVYLVFLVKEQGDKMEQEIQALQETVNSLLSVQHSAITLLEGLAAMIRGASDDPEQILAIAQQLEDSKVALANAIAANTV